MRLTPQGMWGPKKRAREIECPAPQCPSCYLSEKVALSLTIGTQRERGGEGRRQKGSASPLSGATETDELRLSLCSLLFPGDELGVGRVGRFRLVNSENRVVFCLVIRHMPIQGRRNKLKFRFSDEAIESHQLHHVEKTLDS